MFDNQDSIWDTPTRSMTCVESSDLIAVSTNFIPFDQLRSSSLKSTIVLHVVNMISISDLHKFELRIVKVKTKNGINSGVVISYVSFKFITIIYL